MEKLDDEELLIERNAKEYFRTCLNLVDKDELLGAIAALEKAIRLQPSNELFTEFSRHLKEDRLFSMEDSCGSPQTGPTSMKQQSYHPKEGDIDTPHTTSFSSVNGSQKQTGTCNEDNENLKSRRRNCSQSSSNREEKHNISSSEIPEKENPEYFEYLFSDKDKEKNGASDCEKPFWFPNPAKYNVEGFDIDAKFFEEVCKHRESADGWDTYMKLLSDKSQDDDDDTSDESDVDLDVQNIGSMNECSVDDSRHPSEPLSSSNPSERNARTKEVDEEKNSRLESNSPVDLSCEEDNNMKKSSGNTCTSSDPKSAKKPSEHVDKERLYFVNGTGIYGIPPTPADTTSSKPTKNIPTTSKPKMDPSENNFYDNLRFYFKVYDSKSEFDNRNKEATSKEAGSTKPNFNPGASEKPTYAKDERKEDRIPSKETPTSKSDGSTPLVTEERQDTGNSSTHKSRTNSKEHKGTEKAEMPKRGNTSDKKGKKGNKNRNATEDISNSRQTTTKAKQNRKQKHKVSESARENKPSAGKEKTTKTVKEEKSKKDSSNRIDILAIILLIWQAVKKCGIALLWMVWYAIIILLVVLIFAAKCLFSIIKLVMGFIMSWRISVIVMDKLSAWLGIVLVWLIGTYYSCKARCIRWYYGIRTMGAKRFFFGSGRPAQTYNLPNSGEDAIQQLLLKKNSDPYSILGVPNDASNDDIRKQYRKLAVLVHPDKNSHLQCAEAFHVLSGAYDVIGDPEKRLEFDREVARREAFQSSRSQNPQRDFSDPREVFAEFLRQMEEIRESLSCDVCDSRHRRILADRDILHARRCYHCNRMHPAKEGDFWKESTFLGLGRGKFYACMEGRIYDITEWGQCQERNGFSLPSDTHKVLGRISTRPRHQPPPPTSRFEEEIWRELFGQPDRYDGNHGNQGNKNKQQRPRRRKRR